jgi:serine/threonine protein kinase/tetratricopeptide (TPR) repeat protein
MKHPHQAMTAPANSEEFLFNHAAELSAAGRKIYLDQACGDDAGLRARIEALLLAHDGAGNPLDTGPGGVVRDAVARPLPGEKIGTLIGRYKLLQRIGEGGCGAVYLAEQEEPVRRRVALKIIKLGMDSREVIARFEAERQALAMMDHPNIARVFDAGATDQGRPFFVMELVRGVPLTNYCDENNLPTPARLGLFMQVCQAVQHAHQKGIIHRDLKPSNILVTVNDGVAVPKVIDFGIAKATQGRLIDRTLFTAFEQFIGTPAYMSPEQAEMSSLEVDTRSDIYSLGVLLYELLTGRTPFDPKTLVQAGLDEIRRVIREVEPPTPSARLSTLGDADRTTVAKLRSTGPAQLSSLLRGDLDWIVMRCLEKDRRRRYETANGLALDLQRHLNDEPVTARPPSAAYVLLRLIRRHRVVFISAAAIAAALLIGFGISTWEYFMEKAARERAVAAESKARIEAIKSEQVARFLKEMLESVGPYVSLGRDTKLLRDILDKTAERIGRDLKDQPQVEAELRETMGPVYEQLAEYEKAEAMLRAALKLRLAWLAPDDPSVASTQLRVAFILTRRGDFAAAANFLHEALTTQPNPLASGPTMEAEMRGLAPDAPPWKKYLAEVKLIERRIVAAGSRGGKNNDRDISWTIGTIGAIAEEQGDLDMAETSLREALVMQRRLYGPEHEEIAKALMNLGGVAFLRGQYEEAEKTWREALAMQRKILDPEHPDIAQMLMNLTAVAMVRKDYATAEATAREALAMQRKLFPHDHPNIAMALDNLGAALSEQGNPGGAEPLFREALAIAGKVFGDQSTFVGSELNNLAEAVQRQGRPAEAEAFAREALTAWEHADPGAWQGFATRVQLGVSLAAQKKFTEAEPLLLAGYEGMKSRERSMRPDERADNLPDALGHLVQFYTDSGQPEKAAEWRQKLDAYHRATTAAKPAPKQP